MTEKGILLKFLSTETQSHMVGTSSKSTKVTYELVDSCEPGVLIWNKVVDDLSHLMFDDDDSYGIYLEKSDMDCPVPDANYCCAYGYQTHDDDAPYWVNYTVWYVFIESEQE